MTELQQQKIAHFFHVLDHDGNGILESDDFELIGEDLSNIIGYPKESVERLDLKLKAHKLFIQILKDLGKEDANITPDEWIRFFSEVVYKRANDYINLSSTYLFSLFDQDGDGYK